MSSIIFRFPGVPASGITSDFWTFKMFHRQGTWEMNSGRSGGNKKGDETKILKCNVKL